MTDSSNNKNCVCCGDEWKNRKDVIHKNYNSTSSRSFISSYQLLSKFGKEQIKLTFCNLHGNNLRSYTRVTNGTGILKIKNTLTGKWRKATNVGKIVV